MTRQVCAFLVHACLCVCLRHAARSIGALLERLSCCARPQCEQGLDPQSSSDRRAAGSWRGQGVRAIQPLIQQQERSCPALKSLQQRRIATSNGSQAVHVAASWWPVPNLSQRRVGGDVHAVVLAVIDQRVVAVVGMQLNLVASRLDSSKSQQLLHVANGKV